MTTYTRECKQCKTVMEGTRTRSEICLACTNENKLNAKFSADRAILEGLGYVDVKNPGLNKFKQRVWTFTHAKCGEEQTWTFGNLQTQLKKYPNNIPCSYCRGSKT